MKKERLKDAGLYVICDNAKAAGQSVEGGADIIQLRKKNASHRELFDLACAFKKIASPKDVLLIVNDFVDIALASDADGVHLGQDDLPIEAVRRILGKDKIIGLSTHSFHQAKGAEFLGCDYISVGPIYSTPTKPDYPAVGLELIGRVRKEVAIPFVAIGGIDSTNIKDVLAQGAIRIAVVRAVCAQDDPKGAARELRAILIKHIHGFQ